MTNKTIYISGGTSGINLGVATKFAEQGAKVLVFGRDPAKATAAAERIRKETGGEAAGGSADVRDFDAVTELFRATSKSLGPPDIVIAGAAGNFMAPAGDLTSHGFKAVVDIDLLGTFNVFRAGYEIVSKPGASMIAITAPQAVRAMPEQVHVCAAKAGVNMVVKVLALEWGTVGIRVNGISPGPIAGTEGVERMAPTKALKQRWADSIALRRLGTTNDIADVAMFLSSNEASYITGTIIDCDGGMSAGDATGDFTTPRRPPRSRTRS